jgi:hypothetical protein
MPYRTQIANLLSKSLVASLCILLAVLAAAYATGVHPAPSSSALQPAGPR